MNAKNKQFYIGFGMAIAALAREHGEPFTAADIAKCNGVTLRQLKDAGVEEFDLAPLREEMKNVRTMRRKHA